MDSQKVRIVKETPQSNKGEGRPIYYVQYKQWGIWWHLKKPAVELYHKYWTFKLEEAQKEAQKLIEDLKFKSYEPKIEYIPVE